MVTLLPKVCERKKVNAGWLWVVLSLSQVSIFNYFLVVKCFFVYITQSKMLSSLCLHAYFPGARGRLKTDKLSDDVQIKMTLARTAFTSVSEKFLSGEIQMKTLDQILQKDREFVDLLKIGELEYLSISATTFQLPLPLTSLSSPFFFFYFFCFCICIIVIVGTIYNSSCCYSLLSFTAESVHFCLCSSKCLCSSRWPLRWWSL